MKKLKKLEINPERILRNDELRKLHGGWTGNCEIFSGSEDCPYYNGPASGSTCEDAQRLCIELCGQAGCTCDCHCI